MKAIVNAASRPQQPFVRFTGPDKLTRLGRGFAKRFYRAGEGFPDGNQAVSFTLHGFSFSHVPQIRTTGGERARQATLSGFCLQDIYRARSTSTWLPGSNIDQSLLGKVQFLKIVQVLPDGLDHVEGLAASGEVGQSFQTLRDFIGQAKGYGVHGGVCLLKDKYWALISWVIGAGSG